VDHDDEPVDLGPVFRQTIAYLIAFGKPAGHREVARREFDVHSRWKAEREAEEEEEEEDVGKPTNVGNPTNLRESDQFGRKLVGFGESWLEVGRISSALGGRLDLVKNGRKLLVGFSWSDFVKLVGSWSDFVKVCRKLVGFGESWSEVGSWSDFVGFGESWSGVGRMSSKLLGFRQSWSEVGRIL